MSKKKLKVGVSYYGSKIKFYEEWLQSAGDFIEIVRLHHNSNSPEKLVECSALLLTGGSDINPEIYGQSNELQLSKNIDYERDNFERNLIDTALKNNLPILGICRGLQLANAHLGGSLFQHVDNHKNNSSDDDLIHRVKVKENSLLHQITSKSEGNVNSSHHQAVDKIADDLTVSAIADDGIIETLEWKNPSGKSPLLLVQWHPERMKDKEENPFSKEILNWFVKCQIK